MRWFKPILRQAFPVVSPSFNPEREIAPGIVRPSTILAELVCAELIGPNFAPERVIDPRPPETLGYSSTRDTMKWTWKCDKFTLQIYNYGRGGDYDCYTSSLFSGVSFNDYEQKLIKAALNQGFALMAERQRIKRDSDGQQKALDYIEKMWTKPDKEGIDEA